MSVVKRLKLHWIPEGINTVRIFKNWPTMLSSNFRFGNKQNVIAKLRDGAKFKIRTNRADAKAIREVFAEKIYHRHIHRLIENSVVIDIGGNIGAFSILAARENESVKVYTYEPFEENFSLLKENIALNDLGHQVNPFDYAVGGRRCEKVVFIKEIRGTSSLYEKEGKEVRIKMLSLEDIFVDNNIQTCNFLKVDCEGAEYEILYSTPDDIFERIKTISVEFHEVFGTGKGVELKAFLEKHGFRVDIRGKKVGYIYAEKHNKPRKIK